MYCLVQIDNFTVQAFVVLMFGWPHQGKFTSWGFYLWPQGARLQNLYKSWEENPDIGFVVMKVTP